MAWIAGLPCSVCGQFPSEYRKIDAAHTNVFGNPGMARKSPDFSCIPLCHNECHLHGSHSYHKIANEQRWAEIHNLNLPELVAQLNSCWSLLTAGASRAPNATD